ncbi:MAG: PAS domain-containing protein [Deltaproteobacteria bacterium]|nr:PAS domain-containing protein [Deltaproteobacteria bacterium]
MDFVPNTKSLVNALRQSNNGQFAVNPEGKIVYWNQWMEQYSDIQSAKAMGGHLLDLFSGEVKGRLMGAIEGALERGKSAVLSRGFTPHPLPLKHPTLPGSLMTQRVSVRPFNDDEGQRYCMVEIADVSQAVRREQILYEQTQLIEDARRELRVRAASLLRSNQDLRELAEDIETSMRAHLRELHGVLEKNVEPLHSDAKDQGQKQVAKNIQGLGILLDGLGRVAEAASAPLNVEEVELSHFIPQALEKWKQSEGAEVSFDKLELPVILADPALLSNIVQHILENSARYRGEAPLRMEVSALVLDDDVRARIFFRDFGVSLDEDEQKGAFRLFQKYHEKGGDGIGLALCKRWTEALGGEISLHRGRNGGCVVELRLPLATAKGDRDNEVQNNASSKKTLSATGT